jgi:hypothetical protein
MFKGVHVFCNAKAILNRFKPSGCVTLAVLLCFAGHKAGTITTKNVIIAGVILQVKSGKCLFSGGTICT